MSVINDGKAVFNEEIDALVAVRDNLGDKFEEIFNLIINTKGKVVFTAIGKPGHIACKIAATFSSLGIPSFYMHPSEAQHGDLGMLQKQDLVIAISYSGESQEVVRIIPNIKALGIKVVGITGKKNSTLDYRVYNRLKKQINDPETLKDSIFLYSQFEVMYHGRKNPKAVPIYCSNHRNCISLMKDLSYKHIGLSKDLDRYVNNGCTVAFILMQLAIYMGFKEIYMLGADCTYQGLMTVHTAKGKVIRVKNNFAPILFN